MINCISSVTLKTFIALSATIRRKLYTIFCLIIVLFQISFGTPLNYIFFSQVTNQQISLNLQDVILGVISSMCPTLNYLIMIGKLYLWDCKMNGILPNVTCFRVKVNMKIKTEKYISARNKMIHKFYNKWKFFI